MKLRDGVGPTAPRLHTCSAAVQMLPRWQHSNLLRACRAWLERKRRGLEKVTLLAKCLVRGFGWDDSG